jgi:hypothetical protein
MGMQAAQEQLTISAMAKLLFHMFQKFLKKEPSCHGLIMRGDV